MNLLELPQIRPALLLAAALIGSLAPLSTGCLACDAIGLGPSFSLEIVDAEAAPLAAGNYELLVIADGVSWAFECGDPGTLGEQQALDCEGSVLDGEAGEQRFHAELLPRHISFEAGYIGDVDQLGIDMLEVAVLRDGVELASEVYTPDYQELLRGARACGVTEVADAQELSLPSEAQD